jgi:hypothetical protein
MSVYHQENFGLRIAKDTFQDASPCASESNRIAQFKSSSPTVKIIGECALNPQERREDARRRARRSGWREEGEGRC